MLIGGRMVVNFITYNAKYLIKSGLYEDECIHRNKPNKKQETTPNQNTPILLNTVLWAAVLFVNNIGLDDLN